jgi:hypothetical protein
VTFFVRPADGYLQQSAVDVAISIGVRAGEAFLAAFIRETSVRGSGFAISKWCVNVAKSLETSWRGLAIFVATS